MRTRTLMILLFILLLTPSLSFAHPGDTDTFGGHTCHTNCEDWGLNYGEYHYHNETPPKPDTSQEDYDEGYQRGYDDAYGYTSQCIEDYNWSWEGPQAFGDGYEAGIDDGHYDGLAVCEESLSEEEVTYEDIDQEDTDSEVASAEYDDYEYYEEKEENRYDYAPAIAIGGIVGAVGVGYFIKKRRKAPLE